MASFRDDAREVLTEEQFEDLQKLNRKSADFETTSEEEQKLQDLKTMVRQKIAERDKAKNLEFLKSGVFSLADVIKFMCGTDEEKVKKAITQAVRDMFPAEEREPVSIATYKNKAGEEKHLIMFAGKGGRDDETTALVRDGKLAGFIKALHDDGMKWVTTAVIPDAGPYKGKNTYPNLNAVATRFKFDVKELKKQLKLS